MRDSKVKKTRLYFVLAVLLLTTVGIFVYNSVKGIDAENGQASDMAKERMLPAQEQPERLQQVSGVKHPESADRTETDTKESDLTVTPVSEKTTYTLVVTQGRLQVYVVETGLFYMETDIVYDLLPAIVQAQIDKGKYFKSEDALLEFLESYSS